MQDEKINCLKILKVKYPALKGGACGKGQSKNPNIIEIIN